LCWELLDVIFLNQKQPKILPKIPLDPVSSKNNVVFKTAVKWMPKRNIAMQLLIRHKYIKISPTHRQRRIFMHTISRNYPNKYFNILKAQRLKRITEDIMKIMG
jgi:hypothetical protein